MRRLKYLLFHFEHGAKAHTNAKIAIIADIVNQATHFFKYYNPFSPQKTEVSTPKFSIFSKFQLPKPLCFNQASELKIY